MGYDIDNIAPPGSGNSWKPEVGDKLAGTITYIGDLTGPNYDQTATERKLRIDIAVDGDEENVWSIWPVIDTDINGDGYPKADAKAIAAAARAAGAKTLEVGGTLAIKRVEDEETKRGRAKRWVAEYRPPAADAGLLEGLAGETSTAPAPAPAPAAPSVEQRAAAAASLLGDS